MGLPRQTENGKTPAAIQATAHPARMRIGLARNRTPRRNLCHSPGLMLDHALAPVQSLPWHGWLRPAGTRAWPNNRQADTRARPGRHTMEHAPARFSSAVGRPLSPVPQPIATQDQAGSMQIRAGYQITYDCPHATPMILTLRVHPSREPDLVVPDHPHFDRPLELTE
jgi:hypothetical protein